MIANRIVASDIGRCFLAIREDEIAARAVGVNVSRYKLMAFGLGAAISGVAGALVAHFLSYVGPDMFTNWESTLVFVIVLVGGLGSIPGTILGAAVIIGIFESARGLSDYRLYIAGGLLLFVVLIRPSGLIGAVGCAIPQSQRSSKKARAETASACGPTTADPTHTWLGGCTIRLGTLRHS